MTATWTTPRTWAVGELVTAALMNAHVRDNMDWLKTPISASATWSSNFTTTSTTPVDITGATVTLTTNGGGVDVIVLFDAGAGGAATCAFFIVIDGVSYQRIATMSWDGANVRPIAVTIHIPASSLSAASHTIKLQAQQNSGTLTVYGSASGQTTPRFYVIERGG